MVAGALGATACADTCTGAFRHEVVQNARMAGCERGVVDAAPLYVDAGPCPSLEAIRGRAHAYGLAQYGDGDGLAAIRRAEFSDAYAECLAEVLTGEPDGCG